MATWKDVKDAVQAAIALAAQLPADQVIWKYQNAPAPGLDYVTLAFSASKTKGQDTLLKRTNLARPAGQEIEATVIGLREAPLEIECFTGIDPVAGVMPDRALELGEQIRTSLILPSIRARFTAVEVSPFDPGPVQYIPDVVATGFRGRAVQTIRCYLPAPVIKEYYGYIASLRGTITYDGAGLPGPHAIPFKAP